jgi:hypothetical protein
LQASYGKDHPRVPIQLNNLAALPQVANRFGRADIVMSFVAPIPREVVTDLG